MPRKSNRQNRNSSSGGRGSSSRNRQRNARPMTVQEIGVIKDWFDRMRVNVKQGMEFVHQVPEKKDFNESNPLFWATVKSIENVTESVKEVDKINSNILSQLFEITEWKQIKGMRDVVAHQFWKLDHDVIWDTARNELPELHKLLGNLNINDEPDDEPTTIHSTFHVNDTYSPSRRPEFSQPVKPGEFIILAWFDSMRKPHSIRLKEQYEYCSSCCEKFYRMVVLTDKPQQVGRPLSPPICYKCRGLEQREYLLECEDCGARAEGKMAVAPGQTLEFNDLCPECPGRMRIVDDGLN